MKVMNGLNDNGNEEYESGANGVEAVAFWAAA